MCRRILKRVNPEENLWIESLIRLPLSPIRLPLSPIRLPLWAKTNGWVRLDEGDMKSLVVVAVEGVEKLQVAVEGGEKLQWMQECNPMMQ